jgi:predicted dehydrogenase
VSISIRPTESSEVFGDEFADDPVRVAVVGLGYWGPNLVRNLESLRGADLQMICDTDPQRLDQITRRYPASRTTVDFTDVLEDDAIEAVVIATPIRTHYRLADAALCAGKHVFVEKPLAASSAEAQALASTAAQRGLVLLPGHTFLYSPPVLKIRELIRAGTLGDIYFVSTSRVNLGLHQTDVSVVWDLGPHDFSILQFWLEETPTMVSAISRNCIMPGTPDVTFINLEYASETIAQVELSWLAPSKLRRTTIVGSEAMVVYDDTSNEPVRVFDSGVSLPDPSSFGEYRLSYRTGDIVSPRISIAEPLALELADFCTAIRTSTAPHCTAQLGVEVVRLIEAVDRSLETGQRVALAPAGDQSADAQASRSHDTAPRAATSLREVSIPAPERRGAGHQATARQAETGHDVALRADASTGQAHA